MHEIQHFVHFHAWIYTFLSILCILSIFMQKYPQNELFSHILCIFSHILCIFYHFLHILCKYLYIHWINCKIVQFSHMYGHALHSTHGKHVFAMAEYVQHVFAMGNRILHLPWVDTQLAHSPWVDTQHRSFPMGWACICIIFHLLDVYPSIAHGSNAQTTTFCQDIPHNYTNLVNSN